MPRTHVKEFRYTHRVVPNGMGTHVTASMKRRMRHSVAANLRERGEINTLLVATEHRMPRTRDDEGDSAGRAFATIFLLFSFFSFFSFFDLAPNGGRRRFAL